MKSLPAILTYCYYCLYLFIILLSIVSVYKPVYYFVFCYGCFLKLERLFEEYHLLFDCFMMICICFMVDAITNLIIVPFFLLFCHILLYFPIFFPTIFIVSFTLLSSSKENSFSLHVADILTP